LVGFIFHKFVKNLTNMCKIWKIVFGRIGTCFRSASIRPRRPWRRPSWPWSTRSSPPSERREPRSPFPGFRRSPEVDFIDIYFILSISIFILSIFILSIFIDFRIFLQSQSPLYPHVECCDNSDDYQISRCAFSNINLLMFVKDICAPTCAEVSVKKPLENGRRFSSRSDEISPSTDVMITIFCDFWQFSAKKLAFFSKTNVMINFFKN
jgi:hypothetical protein